MKNLMYFLLAGFFLFTACSEDDPVEMEEEEPVEVATPEAKALVGGKAFAASEFGLSTAISGDTYQVTALSDPQTITFFFYGAPEVKTYVLTDDQTASGASVIWASDRSSSTTNHRITNGTLEVTRYDDNQVEATFSGTATSVTDPEVTVEITEGVLVAKFPG